MNVKLLFFFIFSDVQSIILNIYFLFAVRDVPSRGTVIGICGILLIIVTVIAVFVMPAVFVGNTRILFSPSVDFETFSEGHRESD